MNDIIYLSALLGGAIWIWMRDTAWLPVASETLPVVLALPLFVWLGWPWKFNSTEKTGSPLLLGTVLVLGGLGFVLDLTLLLAAAWTVALWNWLNVRVTANRTALRRLAVLPLMAFPWVALDFGVLGWWFRLSAAWVADQVFSLAGFGVLRDGTSLLVGGLPIEVAAACSGMSALQAMLLGGVILAWMELGHTRWYWWSLATLPLLAWTANTLRVCSVVVIALGWGPEAARGWMHQLGGWLVVLPVFFCWWRAARWLGRTRPSVLVTAVAPVTMAQCL